MSLEFFKKHKLTTMAVSSLLMMTVAFFISKPANASDEGSWCDPSITDCVTVEGDPMYVNSDEDSVEVIITDSETGEQRVSTIQWVKVKYEATKDTISDFFNEDTNDPKVDTLSDDSVQEVAPLEEKSDPTQSVE